MLYCPIMSNTDNLSTQAQGEPELSAPQKPALSAQEQRQICHSAIREGYRSLIGVLLGTLAAETVLFIGKVDGTPPLVFIAIGLVLALRHIAQIWQAKEQLKQL